jgi:ferredoxin--NADP+ reductase
MLGDAEGAVYALELEDNSLILRNGETKARGLGSKHSIAVDTVVFAIGDKVDDVFGLPVRWNEFVKHPEPRFPVDGFSYEAYDPETNSPIEGIFVAGWSREASSGLVGIARKDGENGAQAILAYLNSLPEKELENDPSLALADLLKSACYPIVTREDLRRLEEFELAEAKRLNLDEFKLKSNEEMLAVMGIES